jgi:hypothetical protein
MESIALIFDKIIFLEFLFVYIILHLQDLHFWTFGTSTVSSINTYYISFSVISPTKLEFQFDQNGIHTIIITIVVALLLLIIIF